VITHAAKRLNPALSVRLVKALLSDPKRTRALKVGDIKELLRMLYQTNTSAAHALLLEVSTWPCSRHPDVGSCSLHWALVMLDEKRTPKLLVPEEDVFAVIERMLLSKRLPPACKLAIFAVQPFLKPADTPVFFFFFFQKWYLFLNRDALFVG